MLVDHAMRCTDARSKGQREGRLGRGLALKQREGREALGHSASGDACAHAAQLLWGGGVQLRLGVEQVLKIVKHCKDALPSLSSGALLGLDQKGVLEITHSFPTPADSGEEQDRDYQMEMMLALREVNVDNNAVGWYQACFHGTFSYQRLIDDLKHYHETIPNR